MVFGKKNKNKKTQFTNVASLNQDPQAALKAMQEETDSEDEEAKRIRGDIFKMIDQGTASITDLWAPPRMKIQYDNIELGDECLATFTIAAWPESLHYGWINSLLDDPSLTDIKKDVSIQIHPVRKDYAEAYMDDKSADAESSARAEEEKGKVKERNQRIYSKKMRNAEMMKSMLQSKNENLFQVAVVFGIYGNKEWGEDEYGNEVLVKDAYEDLIEKTNRFKKALARNSKGGFAIKPLLHQQRDGIKSLLPWGYGGLHAFQNFYTSALATCYPFTQGSLQTDDGVLHGISLASGQPIFFNTFNEQWMRSFNVIVIGGKGSGKSGTVKTLLGRYATKGTQIFVIDPANVVDGEYTNLATSLNGSVVDFGGKDGIYINPFELIAPTSWKPGKPTKDEDARTIYTIKKSYLTGLIDLMKKIYFDENSATDNLSTFGKTTGVLIDRLYQYKGISIREKAWDYGQWVQERFPTMTDFYFLLSEYDKNIQTYNSREKIQAWGQRHLDANGSLITHTSKSDRIMFGYYRHVINTKSKVWGEEEHATVHFLKNLISEYISDEKQEIHSEKAALFSGKKEADLMNQCVVFRFGKAAASTKALASYMTFELINSRISAGGNAKYKNKIVAMDEAWKFIETKDARKYMNIFYKEGRKTNTGIWLISQEYEDFQGENKVFFDLAETKIIMPVTNDQVNLLMEDMELSSSMANIINADRSQITPGCGVLHVSGKRKETVSFYCCMSRLESAIADTSDSTKPPLTVAQMLGEEKAAELGYA